MRRILSRVLLVALALSVIVTAIHLSDGRGDAVVWMKDFGADRFRHERFELVRPARVVVSASGSYEETREALAAVAWITDVEGEAVWRLRAPRPARGTLVSATDTLSLPAGEYDAYFASFGTGAPAPPPAEGLRARFRSLLSRGRAWRGDAGRWSLRVEAAPGDGDAVAELWPDEGARAARGAVWASGPVGNDDRAEELLRVVEPARVTLRAVLEATPDAVLDSAVVVRLGGAVPDTVWAFRYPGSAPAGGVNRNRRADATLDLEPGLYRVAVQTGPRHGTDGWVLNPPDAPWMWGLTLTSALPSGAVVALAPSDKLELPVIASFACVGEDAELDDTFILDAPTSALIVSAGEVIGETTYDGGVLDRVLPGGGTEHVWMLGREASVPAGGADKNRMALGMLTLEPGTYRLTYRSDGSHNCDDFNSDAPDDPTFWGATLYALGEDFDPASVQRAVAPAAPTPPAPPALIPPGEVIAAISGVAAGRESATGFRLRDAELVFFQGTGLWDDGEAVAYGWVENADGETVWSMRDAYDGKASIFDSEHLPAGSYTLRYKTDADLDPDLAGGSYVESTTIQVSMFVDEDDDPDDG